MKLCYNRQFTTAQVQPGDSEVLQKSTRPYVLVIRWKYKDINYDFAVPIHSNIPASAPKALQH